jgi:hypothetical protein
MMTLPDGAVFAACIGWAGLVACAAWAWYTHDKYRDATETEGIVTKLEFGPHHAVVAYTNEVGDTVSFDSSTPGGLDVGQRVPVLYIPHDRFPDEIVGTFDAMYGMQLTFGKILIPFAVGGTALTIYLARSRKRRLPATTAASSDHS